MLVTILMLGLAIACAALGFWALRQTAQPDPAESVMAPRRPAPRIDSGRKTTELLHPSQQTPIAPALPIGGPQSVAAQTSETETSTARVFLDFDGALGRIHIERPEVVIGRHTKDDIHINDVRVSRHHARLVAKRNGGFEIHNLTAVRPEPNPMQINGETREHADIVDGDIVSLGGVSFTFRMAA